MEMGTYTDATVQSLGEDHFLHAPNAMLRAYANDPDFFGDEDYQRGNGIRVSKRKDTWPGYVIDCDGDIALKRTVGIVLGHDSFGHGSERWVVLVRDKDEHDSLHIERWDVSLGSNEEVAASREDDE